MNPDSFEALNRAAFLALNGTPDTPSWVLAAALFSAVYLIWLLPVLLVALWLGGDARRRSLALRAGLVVLVALALNQLAGVVWPHPRPFVIGLGHTFLPHDPDSSFPSDHGTIFLAFAFTLLAGGLRRTGAVVLGVGALVAWARICVGVHYPLDMIGAVASAAFGWGLVAPLWRVAGERATQCAVALYRRAFARPIRGGWLRA